MLSIDTKSLKETNKAAISFLKEFKEERIFAFYGKMGAGKTTFIKALCQTLGSKDNITSPTFAIINEYDTPKSGQIYHFDFYRIKNIEEAMDIGIDDYLNSGDYCFIEWPEKIEELLPEELIEVNIKEISPTSRHITAKKRQY
ncbi:MAG: tRNA (adenosine(37)-N6)-threonylcarbamoyltransferase complex ATPase subunit type 1 TsaE [Prolixibacteraceae bacterium]|nr:tRNA (adenosine(37)-N6)-threonylcarbamoyltransferase complex ATPase subunit type 1 TsaE [Prolixibacteraceae bacterium]